MRRAVQDVRAMTLELGAMMQKEKAKEGIPDQRNCLECLENAEGLARPEPNSQAGDENEGAAS